MYCINTNEFPGKLFRKNLIFSHVKITCCLCTWKDHSCCGYIINCTFYSKSSDGDSIICWKVFHSLSVVTWEEILFNTQRGIWLLLAWTKAFCTGCLDVLIVTKYYLQWANLSEFTPETTGIYFVYVCYMYICRQFQFPFTSEIMRPDLTYNHPSTERCRSNYNIFLKTCVPVYYYTISVQLTALSPAENLRAKFFTLLMNT